METNIRRVPSPIVLMPIGHIFTMRYFEINTAPVFRTEKNNINIKNREKPDFDHNFFSQRVKLP
jgi:hypothetical protein